MGDKAKQLRGTAELGRSVAKAQVVQKTATKAGRTPGPVNTSIEQGPDAKGRVFRKTGVDRPKLHRFDKAMKAFMTQNELRGGTLAVVKDRRLVFARGYTFGKPSDPTVEPGSLFRIASASKPITAVAIYQLIEAAGGAFPLGAKVQDVLGLTTPEGKPLPADHVLPSKRTPPAKSMTPGRYFHAVELQHLLSHTGGWHRGTETEPTHRRDVEVAGAFGHPIPVDRREIASWGVDRDWHFEPGADPEGDKYSNFGYSLLGLVIEEKAGKLYDKFVMESVFGPIGVHRPRLSRPLKEDRRADEVEYFRIPELKVSSMVHADGRLVPEQYGGENNDNFASFGGWAMAAPDYARFLAELQVAPNVLLATRAEDLLVWKSKPAVGGGTVLEHGAMLPGSIGYVASRSDGVAIVVFWNTSRDSYSFNFEKQSFADHSEVWNRIASEIEEKDWPKDDLFPQLLPPPPKQGPDLRKDLVRFTPVLRPRHLPNPPLERLRMRQGLVLPS